MTWRGRRTGREMVRKRVDKTKARLKRFLEDGQPEMVYLYWWGGWAVVLRSKRAK